jgi:Myb-like DNA-binding domain
LIHVECAVSGCPHIAVAHMCDHGFDLELEHCALAATTPTATTMLLQEDELIVELVRRFGAKRWSQIAAELPGRIGKQCRER